MYKVVLIDDNEIFLESLKKTAPGMKLTVVWKGWRMMGSAEKR